ncbi:MAG: glutamine amidotransferase [Planctomycetota bacterium]|jgi:uncharacterized membrane protein
MQFANPQWLLILPPLVLLVWWIARRSMSGLSRRTRLLAILIRAIVLASLVGVLARPSWRRVSDDLAVTVVFDTSRSVPRAEAQNARRYIQQATSSATPRDRLGVVSAGEEAFVQALPSARVRTIELGHTGGDNETDLASSVRLAMAVAPENAASRIVLVSDGNETSGSLLEAVEAARAASIPIDVLPVRYRHDVEVSVERVVVPATARRDETVPVRFVIESTHQTTGRLSLTINGQPVDLDTQSDAMSSRVDLDPGINVRSMPVTLPGVGAHRFEAFYEPATEGDDTVSENNSAQGVTFISSDGRILVYTDDIEASTPLINALHATSVEVDVRSTISSHESLEELAGYDAVVLMNTPSDSFSFQQQEELLAYVHDLGGGMIVVGGESSFGAGGWIGSPIADALPIVLDPPHKRELPRGALALIMHSCEMPQGNHWGQKTGEAAIQALTGRDIVGILEYNWQGGSDWVHPLSLLGDKRAALQAMNSLTFGDMPDFNQAMELALQGLQGTEAGAKHCIIISDGDPSGPGPTLTQKFINAGISVSTVVVFPHGGGQNSPDVTKMRALASATGGQFYFVGSGSALRPVDLPQIFIREARTIKRSLIWEGPAFVPDRKFAGAETMRGIGDVPPITGYIVAGDREGLSQVTLRGHEGDPILAQWQHGLGRVVTFTSDATTRWSSDWVAWSGFAPFWEAHMRWAMRPSGSQLVSVTTQQDGDTTRVVVDALDPDGERLNFARFAGSVVDPELGAIPITLNQVGPGRYEGEFDSGAPGAYVMSFRYDAPSPDGPVRGSVQASVVRASGSERRALTDNRAMLQQVADRTGGRILPPDPLQANLFERQGLSRPVSLRSVWIAVAMGCCGLFLLDVAVRRVRLDARAVLSGLQQRFGVRQGASEQQLSTLRQIKSQTRRELNEQPDTSRVKFEADETHATIAPLVESDKPSRADIPAPSGTSEQTAGEEESSGLSRLREAKRRARENMDDDA